MKRIVAVLFFLILCVGFSRAQQNIQVPVDSLWDRANTAYVNGDYATAIITYDSLSYAGYESNKLYYNIGNAYFKAGSIGKSILYYNRALRLDPSDSDTRHNLRIANTYVKDKIDSVPEFFVAGWIRGWKQSLSSNAWAAVSLVMLALALGAVLFYLLSRNIKLRKAGFYTAIGALIIGVCAVSFSVSLKNQVSSDGEAVVMISAAPVKSSPDNQSKDIFILHEGTKVEIISSLGDWREIVIADGNKGWILHNSIEVI